VWYNTNVYNLAPGVIVGCGIMEQKKLVMEILQDVLDGKIQYGTAQTVGIKDGYINFDFDAPLYISGLTLDIREKFRAFMDKAGE
jgi:simple sugar transport system substrate-binding protein